MQPQEETPPAGVAAPAAPALARNNEEEVVAPRNRSRSAPPERPARDEREVVPMPPRRAARSRSPPEREVIGMPPARAQGGASRRRLQRDTPVPIPPPAPVPAPAAPVRRGGRAPPDPNRETPPRLRFWHPPPPPNDLNPQTYPVDPNTGRQRGCTKCRWDWYGCEQCIRPDYRPRAERPDRRPDGGRAMGRGRKKG